MQIVATIKGKSDSSITLVVRAIGGDPIGDQLSYALSHAPGDFADWEQVLVTRLGRGSTSFKFMLNDGE